MVCFSLRDAELKDNMRKTKDNVLDINKLLLEVRPLAEIPLSSDDDEDQKLAKEETSGQDVPIALSISELSKSVSEFLEVCLQELYDL